MLSSARTRISPLYAFVLLIAALSLDNAGRAVASSGALFRDAVQCSQTTVCDHALGLSLTVTAGVVDIGPGQRPPHEIELVTLPARGRASAFRLDIASWGTTTDMNDTRAASAGMQRLLRAERQHARLTTVHYGGASGLLAPGLHSSPTEVTVVVLAHAGAVYKILAPGSVLAPDQRQMLASLRFIARVGPFPPENPSAPTGPESRRNIPGGIFGRESLTLTLGNGLRRGAHTYSLWFHALGQKSWLLSYSVPCTGRQAQLVVDIVNQRGRVVDRVLHRRGSAADVRQTEEIGGVVRLDVRGQCPTWKVMVSGIIP
jgi:hypothetical protein